MKKIAGLAPSLFVLFFCFAFTAQAMPPGGHPAPGMMPDTAATKTVGKDLVVTLEYPRDSAWLAGKAQQGKESGAKVTMKVPVTETKFDELPMALVDGEPLTIEAFRQALRPAEAGEGEVVEVTGQDPQQVLERLINSMEFLAEAREIGLDQLPDVTKFVRSFRNQTLRGLLLKKHAEAVEPDEKMVEDLYREAIKETKMKAVLFVKEEDAKDFVAMLGKEGDFDKLAKQAVADEKATFRGGEEGKFVPRSEMAEDIAPAIDTLKIGQVSAVIPTMKQFAVVKVLDFRYPENPHAKAKARTKALNFAQNSALGEFTRILTEKYVKLDRALFESLDFEKDMDKLLEDKRVLAEIKGIEPVTVAAVAEALKSRYYHGFERAVAEGKIADDKIIVLNEYIANRVFIQEALAEGIDKTKEFLRQFQDYENSMVFGMYMQKVLVPKLTIVMDDLRAYYKKHEDKYKTPRMLGVHSLVFNDQKNAQDALKKLQQGTEVSWLDTNAPGQVSDENADLLDFGSGLITTASMPADVQKKLEKVAVGDFRLYNDDKGHHYVLVVQRVIPARQQPFEQVQGDILKAVYGEKLQDVMTQWGQRLRESYPVEIFVKEFNSQEL